MVVGIRVTTAPARDLGSVGAGVDGADVGLVGRDGRGLTCGDWVRDVVVLGTDEDRGREDVVAELGVVAAALVVVVAAVLARGAVERSREEQPASRAEDDRRSTEVSK